MTMDHSDLGRDALLDRIDDCDDAAAKFGARETWNGDAVQVVRDAQGRFVTWRAVSPPTSNTSRAVADGGREEISWTSDKGAEVTAWAESGTLFASVSLDAPQIEIDQTSAQIREINGMDALYLGIHRVGGDRRKLDVPIDGRVDELEQLREASIDTSPLTYEVEEYTETSRAGGWGKQTFTRTRLATSKSYGEMTEREKELHPRVDTDRVPEDAEPGDVLTFEDLLDDPRTRDEKEQDALDEAAETGGEVVISRSTTGCNDPSAECNLDHVTRVATPDGEIETRRTHTY